MAKDVYLRQLPTVVEAGPPESSAKGGNQPRVGRDRGCASCVHGDAGGVGDVLLVTREGLLYVELLEFADGLIQEDVAFEHFVDQVFETVVNQSSFPVSSR